MKEPARMAAICSLARGDLLFLCGDDIIKSRDPESDGVEGVRLNYLLGHDVALSHCFRDGMILVLDTKASMLPLELLLLSLP
jgi:hypothetical protein